MEVTKRSKQEGRERQVQKTVNRNINRERKKWTGRRKQYQEIKG